MIQDLLKEEDGQFYQLHVFITCDNGTELKPGDWVRLKRIEDRSDDELNPTWHCESQNGDTVCIDAGMVGDFEQLETHNK